MARYDVEMMEADESDPIRRKQAAAQRAMQQRQQFRDGMKGQAIDRFENIQGRHVNLPGGEPERSRSLAASGQSGLVGPPRPLSPEMMEANEPKFGARPNPPIARADEYANAGVSTPAPSMADTAKAEMMEAQERTGFGPRQPARDQAMLRKRENIGRAQLEGQTNRFSVFNPNHPSYNPMRAQMLLDQEDMRLQRADAERAANPPRYALPTEPGQAGKRADLERMFEQELIREADAKRPPGEVGPPDLSGVAPRVSEFRGRLEQNAQLSPDEARSRAEAIAAQDARTQDSREQVRVDQANRDKARTRARTLDELDYNTAVAEQKLRERTAQAAGTRAEADATRAQIAATSAKAESEIMQMVAPDEVRRTQIINDRANSPVYKPAVENIANAIKSMSGKAWRDAQQFSPALNDGFAAFQRLPDHLQSAAALEIINNLRESQTDLPKEALQDAGWTWLINKLIPFETPAERNASQMQDRINKFLAYFKSVSARAPISSTALTAG